MSDETMWADLPIMDPRTSCHVSVEDIAEWFAGANCVDQAAVLNAFFRIASAWRGSSGDALMQVEYLSEQLGADGWWLIRELAERAP